MLTDDTPVTPPAWSPTTTPLEDLVGVPVLSLIPPGGTPPAGAGGDSFDLADVGLGWARYVKIQSATYATGANNAGFDLDAVVAIHSEAEVPALSGAGRGALALLLAAVAIGLSRRAR